MEIFATKISKNFRGDKQEIFYFNLIKRGKAIYFQDRMFHIKRYGTRGFSS